LADIIGGGAGKLSRQPPITCNIRQDFVPTAPQGRVVLQPDNYFFNRTILRLRSLQTFHELMPLQRLFSRSI
jgi:hypothetical protein